MAQKTVQIRIDHIADDGLGYGRSTHFEVGVAGVSVGDVVDVELTHKRPHDRQALGRVRRVHARGGDFVRPACHHAAPVRGRCGGCPWMHLTGDAQASLKHQRVEDALSSFEGYRPKEGLEAPAGVEPNGLLYRNRAIYTVFRPKNGKIHLGSRRPGHVGYAKMEGCLVNTEVVESVAHALTAILEKRHIPVYPARSGLRYVVIRANQRGEALVELICAQKRPGWMDAVVGLLREHPAVRGIFSSVNKKDTNVFRLQSPKRLWGDGTLVEALGDVRLHLTIDAFFQLNARVAADMYRHAAQHTRDARVIWDLYCGVGGLGMTIAQANRHARLYGCELTESAVRLARKNAEENALTGQFDVANLHHGVPRGWKKADLVVVNPPRRGLDSAVRGLLRKTRPRQIAYMSCSVTSLKRDLEAITESGYRICWHGAWDMLPHTTHVETLVVLDRKEGGMRRATPQR